MKQVALYLVLTRSYFATLAFSKMDAAHRTEKLGRMKVSFGVSRSTLTQTPAQTSNQRAFVEETAEFCRSLTC